MTKFVEWTRRLVLVAVVAALWLGPAGARAEADPEVEAALDRYFRSETLQPDWFAPSFLSAVPFTQLEPLRQMIAGSLGKYEGIRPAGDRWEAVYEKGIIPTLASVDGQGRFVGLRLLPPRGRAHSLDEVLADIRGWKGETSLLVLVDGNERVALATDRVLAVGSAFKLAILRALQLQIEAGRRAWDDVVELRDEARSLPGGFLQDWPHGSPLTLHTLATLMISQSDNTATDALLLELGRDRVEEMDPAGHNRPFLTTGEAFRLKNPANADLLGRWRAADEEGRRALLSELQKRPLPHASLFGGDPVHTDVEWFFRPGELCKLLGQVSTLDLTGVNPGVVPAKDWSRVAFKGGSEPGVLNFTNWAQDGDGREICVCLTRNSDEIIDTFETSAVVSTIFELLRSEAR